MPGPLLLPLIFAGLLYAPQLARLAALYGWNIDKLPRLFAGAQTLARTGFMIVENPQAYAALRAAIPQVQGVAAMGWNRFSVWGVEFMLAFEGDTVAFFETNPLVSSPHAAKALNELLVALPNFLK